MDEAGKPWTVERFAELGSTMNLARDRARDGVADRTAIRADRQTGGHGRQGRPWSSPEGNVYLTAILRPQVPAGRAFQASLVAAVALAETIAPLVPGHAVTVKWPNDVLLDGGKLAGILCESMLSGGRLVAVLAGVGVNIWHKPELPDRRTSRLVDALPQGAGASRLPGTPDLRDLVAEDLLRSLDHWFGIWSLEERGGFARVREVWLARGPESGSPISVRLDDRRVDGRFKALGEAGDLHVVDATTGEERTFIAGEVIG